MLYRLTRKDLLGNLPYNKILQANYNDKEVYPYLKQKLNSLQKRFKAGNISLVQVQLIVDELLVEVRELYPESFPEVGWLDKKSLPLLEV